jgi:signal transduction histidine kinase/DNA-binding NarL/FixJ family response regulator
MSEKPCLRILHVEDNDSDSELIQRALHRAGIEAEWTRVDTKENYLAQLTPSYDIILADHALPRFSGLEALQLLHAHKLDIPFIILSGTLGEEAAVEYIKQGATGYLSKDRLGRLDRVIHQALEKRKLHQHPKNAQDELARRLRESEAMTVITQALSETLELDKTLQLIVESALRILPKVERAVIHLLDDEHAVLRTAAISGVAELTHGDQPMQPGEGIAGTVVVTGEIIHVNDTSLDTRFVHRGPNDHMRSLLVAPVQSGGRRLGTISVISATPHAFSEDDERLLGTLSSQAAVALEKARLFSETRSQLVELTGLHRDLQEREKFLTLLQKITRVALEIPAFYAMLQELAERLNELFQSDGCCITLWDEARQTTIPAAATAPMQQAFLTLPIESGETTLTAEVMRTGRALVGSRDLPQGAAASFSKMIAAHTVLGLPFIAGGEKLGAALIAFQQAHEFTSSEIARGEQAAGQIALAIAKARSLDAEREQRKLTEALRRQEQAIRARLIQHEKLAAIGRLTASVAHELNNPLQAIQNALYLVSLESPLSHQAREDLRVALNESDRMAGLISRLRETYRPRMEQEYEQVSLNEIVEEVHQLLETHMRHNQVSYHFEPDPNLQPITALGDQIKQVILNLCLNAIEAMTTGGHLKLTTQAKADEKGHQGTQLMVADTGSGIEAALIGNIFEPFFTTKQSGTGLGLAIIYEIVQRHQGKIEVESEIGKGTTFKVWLPC